METRELSLQEIEQIEGGGKINACDAALGLAVSIWGIALSAASFGVAAFIVGWGGGMLVGYVCHAND